MRTFRIHEGDALAVLKGLPEGGAQTCVTSPPYFGLRDYGIKGQIGRERTPTEYVARLVEIFRGVRRVLRDDGTVFLNLGDSYASDSKWGGSTGGKHAKGLHGQTGVGRERRVTGLGDKQLLGVPWRAALALQDDGWVLRQDLIWHKPSPMPEGNITDRLTKAHEYVFLLAKSGSYFFNQEAVAEPSCAADRPQYQRARELAEEHGLTAEHIEAIRSAGITDTGKARVTQDGTGKNSARVTELAAYAKEKLGGYYREFLIDETRNRRSVLTIPTENFKGAHFAVMPTALAEFCVLAGSREGDTVLDPFTGSGTSGLVALRLNRNFVGAELNPDYAAMTRRRILNDAPLLNREAA